MRRRRLVAQLFPSYLIIVLLALLAVTWYVSQAWRQAFLEQTAADLKIRADLVIPQFQELLSPLKAQAVDRLCKELGRLSAHPADGDSALRAGRGGFRQKPGQNGQSRRPARNPAGLCRGRSAFPPGTVTPKRPP